MNGLTDILFLDIETVSGHLEYDAMDERLQKQWLRKASYINQSDISAEQLYFEKAAIYAEFGKVITIGLGYFNIDEETVEFRTKSLANHDETKLLEDFKAIVSKMNPERLKLCAHNGREFDFPYISRRMLINEIKLPSILNLSGKKPWEVNHLDTMDMWKFGDWKHYSSLELLASVFGIDSSKSGMDGSQVNEAYYTEDRLDDIASYCIQDVVVTAQLFLKLNSISFDDITFIDTNNSQ